MSPILWRSGLRHFGRHPWQPLLSVLGVGLGVAVVLAVDLANTSARTSFEYAVEQISGRATHRIVGPPAGFSESIYARLRVELGVQDMAPVVTGFARAEAIPGLALQVLGIDVLSETRFREVSSGATNAASLLVDRHAALISASLKGPAELTLLAGPNRLTLRPLIAFDDPRMDGLVVTDISTAQELFGHQGKLSYIDLIVPENERGRKLTAAVENLLPYSVRIVPAMQNSEAVGKLSDSFSLNLTAMSLLALLVGMFLIYNAMAFSVVQRRPLLGLLRALGVSRRELFALVLGEALLLGALGTVLGGALGIWLGSGLVHLVTRTINDLYYTLNVTALNIAPLSLLKVALLGIVATVCAAWMPAREAANAPAGAVLSRAHLESRWRDALPGLNTGGVVLLGLGAAIIYLSAGLLAGFGGLFLLVLGCALLTPTGLLLLSRALALSAKGSGTLVIMACRDIGSHLSRTGMAAAALMVAFSAAVGVGVMVDSFRSGVSLWLHDLLNADLYISVQSQDTDADFTPLNPLLVERLRTLPGIAAISTFNFTSVRIDAQLTRLVIAELAPAAQQGYRFLAGNPHRAWSAFNAGTAVLISEPLAFRHGLAVNDRITLTGSDGPHHFPIAGIFHDYSSEHGRILLHRSGYDRYWNDTRTRSLAVYTRPGTDIDRLRNSIAELGESLQALQIRSNRELRERSLVIFERTFTITGVLRLLAVGIAFVGVLSALMALQLERTREYAILRALGMTPWEISRLISLQTSFLGLCAGVLAVPTGLLLALVLIFVINRRAFGWTLPFQVDPYLLIQCILLAGLAAFLAGLYPAWRISRAAPADALRSE